MRDSLLHLTAAIATRLDRLQTTSPAMRSALRHLSSSVASAAARRRCAMEHRYAALVSRAAANSNDSIAKALLALTEPLPWIYHYESRAAGEDLSDHIAFAELIGPDGPLHAPGCRVGFTVVAERTIYPMHAHPAVELYFVVSGRARWQTPTIDQVVPPGELVLHGSSEPHAMQTFDEPLLALWGWSGDLDSRAAYV